MDTTPQPKAGPIQPGERIQTIDILRGFAIFGILLVNIEFFKQSGLSTAVGLREPATLLDQLARWFIAFFAEGKFYSIFAFLFGIGMAIQFQRAEQKGVRFFWTYFRRLLVLLGIGLIHAYLFWVGDILILYSVLGFLLLFFFRKARPKTLFVWTIIFLLIPILFNAGLLGLVELGKMAPGGEEMMAQVFAEQEAQFRALDAQAEQVYATGTFVEITRQRVSDMNFIFVVLLPFMGFNVLAMMTLGLYAGKRRIFEDIPGNLPLIRKLLIWGLVIGVIGNLAYVWAGEFSSRTVPSALSLLSSTAWTFGAPALSLFYMSALTLLVENAARRARLAPMASAGRMAITNYLMQTVICTTLFYGYGFGLFGKIGIAAGILLTAAVFAIELVWSAWWLKRFRFGPVEWLWRTLTYLKAQPMR
ncbi:MAG: DUF418 domain-containing protein [Anaerolineales bacterium]|nr:DUF418 domain-containing protein [Anaerolineales bacterium]